ncbi:hypothetical protein [Massilia sp. BHUDP2]|uniref:hypothetical protein n=1 Tax=Massilia sp. BHUDP2 TaxID=3034505 RepID=UPI0039063C0A
MISQKPVPNDTVRHYLQRAAEAGGIQVKWDQENGFTRYDNNARWNPWDDNGDALDLAEKMMMTFSLEPSRVAVHWGLYGEEENTQDTYATLRRLIVRVAAESGAA